MHTTVVACLAAMLVGCLTADAPDDQYAGIVGATVLDGGKIVVLPPTAPDADTDMNADVVDAASFRDEAAVDGALASEQELPPDGCDYRGRWLVSDRFVATGMNIQQVTFNWRYYEIDQRGTRLEVKRGLLCGRKTIPLGALGVTIDFSGQLAAMLTRERDDGRTASVRKTASGCELNFPKHYTVEGATTPYYENPAVALPSVMEKADGMRPGWEDWDEDGKPGIAVKSSGFANGTLHIASRTFNVWTGTTGLASSSFKLAQSYGFLNRVLLIEGSELLNTSATVDPDASQHFVRFVKLSDTQASASEESALCAEIRRLAPELAPDANR